MTTRHQILRQIAKGHADLARLYASLAEIEGDYTPGCPLTEACRAVGVSVADIQSNRRFAAIYAPRCMVCALLRMEVGMSFHRIANLMGNRDHSAIMHAMDRHREMMDADPAYRLKFETAKQQYCAARIRVVQQQESEAA